MLNSATSGTVLISSKNSVILGGVNYNLPSCDLTINDVTFNNLHEQRKIKILTLLNIFQKEEIEELKIKLSKYE